MIVVKSNGDVLADVLAVKSTGELIDIIEEGRGLKVEFVRRIFDKIEERRDDAFLT